MKMNTHKPLTRTILASTVAAMLAFSATVSQADEAKQDKTAKPAATSVKEQTLSDRETVAQYPGWQDPNMARIAVHGGRALLRRIQDAHVALSKKKIGVARSDLSAAKDFAEGLRLMIPYTVVVDNIRNAKKELLSSDKGILVNDMLPVYSNLDEMADFAPELAKKAKTKITEAVKHAKNGDKKKAAEKLDEVAADISSTTVYLPVLYVEAQVAAASSSLDKDPADTKTANTAIDNAMGSMIHATVNMHLFPEEKAKATAAKSTASTKPAMKATTAATPAATPKPVPAAPAAAK